MSAVWSIDVQGAITKVKIFLKDNGVQSYILDSVRQDSAMGKQDWVIRVRLTNIFGPQKEIVVDDRSGKITAYRNPGPP